MHQRLLLRSRRGHPMLAALSLAVAAVAGCGDDSGQQSNDNYSNCEVDLAEFENATVEAANPDAVPLDEQLFNLGVQAGSMMSTRALLWSYASDGLDKRLRVWRYLDSGDVAVVHDATVLAAEGYLKADVSGLAPGTWYHYAFFDDATPEPSARSVIGRFRTALPDQCDAPITIAGTHGTNIRWAPFKALDVTARQEVDLFVQLGDMSYNDGAETLQEFRDFWHETLQEPGYSTLLPSTGQYITWDDHEVADNSVLYSLPEDVVRNGIDAFFETLPVPRYEDGKAWTSYRWGRTAELFVLDCRYERDPDSRETADPIYISKEQMAWLKDGIQHSEAHFKIIVNSVPIIDFPSLWVFESDRWEGYMAQRDELLDFITDQDIQGVWFLSGDFHVGLVGRVDREGPRRKIWEVLMGPGGNTNPIWGAYLDEIMPREDIAPPDQFEFFTGEFVATTMTFEPRTNSVHIKFIDAETEEVLYQDTIRDGEPVR